MEVDSTQKWKEESLRTGVSKVIEQAAVILEILPTIIQMAPSNSRDVMDNINSDIERVKDAIDEALFQGDILVDELEEYGIDSFAKGIEPMIDTIKKMNTLIMLVIQNANGARYAQSKNECLFYKKHLVTVLHLLLRETHELYRISNNVDRMMEKASPDNMLGGYRKRRKQRTQRKRKHRKRTHRKRK
jgi:hypothetical protein